MKRFDIIWQCEKGAVLDEKENGKYVLYEAVADYDARIEFIQRRSLYADYLKYLTTRDNQASKSFGEDTDTIGASGKKVVEENGLTSCSVSTQQSLHNTVEFKSSPEFYFKERDGIKPNTVRNIDVSDERFLKLNSGDARFVRIFNAETRECFDREITNYSEWNGVIPARLAIISWKHPTGHEK